MAPPPRPRSAVLYGTAGRALAAAAVSIVVGGVLARVLRQVRPHRLDRKATAVLGASVLWDSGVGHYRGQFHNPAMWTAPLTSATLCLCAARSVVDDRQSWRRVAIYEAAVTAGAIGSGFHLYNVVKRVGGLSWQNLFYGAPLGAPGALAVAGLMGIAGERAMPLPPRLRLGAVAIGIAFTIAEAALLHFRGAFQNRYMVLPLTVPTAAALAAGMAARRPEAALGIAETLLGATLGLGALGALFHAYGVHRNMGGWANASQNVLNGPPLGAPPGFAALALAGLSAVQEIRYARSLPDALSGIRRAGEMGQPVVERRHPPRHRQTPARHPDTPVLHRGGMAPS